MISSHLSLRLPGGGALWQSAPAHDSSTNMREAFGCGQKLETSFDVEDTTPAAKP